MKSWKTTAAGWAGAIGAVLVAAAAAFDADPTTVPNWGVALALVMTALGLTAARDNNVSSEDAEIK